MLGYNAPTIGQSLVVVPLIAVEAAIPCDKFFFQSFPLLFKQFGFHGARIPDELGRALYDVCDFQVLHFSSPNF
jgi:hypothetical protein